MAIMKREKMITGLTVALFSLAFVGAFFVQGDEEKAPELGYAIERNIISSSRQLDPNANWLAIEELSNEDSLEDLENAYYYQMIEDEYIHINDCQMEVAPLAKSRTGEPFAQAKHNQSCDC
jgi:hypothetical protein